MAKMVKFYCPECRDKWETDMGSLYRGLDITCSVCHTTFTVDYSDIATLKSKLQDEFGEFVDFDKLNHPDFTNIDLVHNWRNHIPETCVQLWSRLSTETRMVLYVLASQEAHNEVWE